MINVLVTACGCPGGPSVIKALQRGWRVPGAPLAVPLRKLLEPECRVIGTDCSPTASGRFFVDSFYQTPRGTHPDFVEALLLICDVEGIDVVLPESSHEVMALAEARDQFAQRGIKVLVSSPRAVEIALDKATTYRKLSYSHTESVPMPEWSMAQNEDRLHELAHWLGYPEEPIVVKSPTGKGGRGFRVVRADVDRMRLDMRTWPNSHTVTLDEIHGPWPLMVMEHLLGDESSADTFDAYGAQFGFTKIRRDCRMGLHHQHEVRYDPWLWEQGVKVVEALGLEGFVNVQFMAGKLLEVNPRISTNFYPPGSNYPLAGVRAALGMDPGWASPPEGTQAQYYHDLRTF